jgi:Tol biopolymer transport system component
MLVSAVVDRLIKRMKEKKIVQWGLAYLAGAYATMGAWELVFEKTWGFPEQYAKALFILLAVGFFVSLVIAWYHGEQERERVSGPELLMVAVLLLIGGIALTFLKEDTGTAVAEVQRDIEFEVRLPSGRLHGEHPIALSPDGSVLAFAAREGGVSRVYLRALNNLNLDTIPGTEGAEVPFFSPDGSELAFFADGELKKVPVRGGRPSTVTTDVPGLPKGGVWGENDTIYYECERGIYLIPAGGGIRDSLPGPPGADLPRLEQYIPEHPAILATLRGGVNQGRIAVYSFKNREWRTLRELGVATQAKYVEAKETGYLVFAPAGNFRAVRFDVEDLEVKGSPSQLEDFRSEWVEWSEDGRGPRFDISKNATLAFMPRNPLRKLLWVSREGLADTLEILEQDFGRPRISPDGRHLLVTIFEQGGRTGGYQSLWWYNLNNPAERRQIVPGTRATDGVWGPEEDVRYVVFAANDSTTDGWDVWAVTLESPSTPDPLVARPNDQFPHSWSRDWRLAYYELQSSDDQSGSSSRDLWVYDQRIRTDTPCLETEYNERSPVFSPDGSRIAYVSDQTGQDQVYVQEYPGTEPPRMVSVDGGRSPLWGRDGRELFFRRGNLVLSVQSVASLKADGSERMEWQEPRVLFSGEYDIEPGASGSVNYDYDPGRDRFFMIHSDPPDRILVVVNWQERLKAVLPNLGR